MLNQGYPYSHDVWLADERSAATSHAIATVDLNWIRTVLPKLVPFSLSASAWMLYLQMCILCMYRPRSATAAWCAENGVKMCSRMQCWNTTERPGRRTNCKVGNLSYFYDHWRAVCRGFKVRTRDKGLQKTSCEGAIITLLRNLHGVPSLRFVTGTPKPVSKHINPRNIRSHWCVA